MPESIDLFYEIAKLSDRIDDINAKMDALVLVNVPQLTAAIIEKLEADPTMREAFLLVNGKRTQGEIASELAARGFKASEATISRKIDTLREEFGLIKLAKHTKDGKKYTKTTLAKTLRVERALAKPKGNTKK